MKQPSKYYNGIQSTAKCAEPILGEMLFKIGQRFDDKPQAILDAWTEIVGSRIASMTQAVCFKEGTLYVCVGNSTLYSLLIEHEKMRLLKIFQSKFPKVKFQNIHFKIGLNV